MAAKLIATAILHSHTHTHSLFVRVWLSNQLFTHQPFFNGYTSPESEI
jgi:hypothetical protein